MSSKDSNISKKGSDLENFIQDKENNYSLNYGVTPDKLNNKKLFGLFLAGIILVVVLVYISMTLFNYYAFTSSQAAAESAVFYEIEDLKAQDKQLLTTFGVIDEESGLFRVPVDTAITLILEDYTN
jgi:hypothetical protein